MFTTNPATQAGHDAGLAVLAGTLLAEDAGDAWLAWADKSHAAGVAFLRAFDATGAER